MIRNQLIYLFGLITALPLLPVLWLQGQKIRQTMPKLPEATGPKNGTAGEGPPLKMLVLGESTVAGVGVETYEQSIAAKLARRLAKRLSCTVHWTASGISGLTAHSLTAQLVEGKLKEPYDFIVVCLGGNDAFSLHGPLRWKRDCLYLVQAIRKEGQKGPILFADVPPIREFPGFTPLLQFFLGRLALLYREPLRELERCEEAVFFTDKLITFDLTHGHTIHDYFSDGVHPSALTYKNWADDMAERAETIFQDAPPRANRCHSKFEDVP